MTPLEEENRRFRAALEEIKDADKCNFSADGVAMAVRVAKAALGIPR